jgi:hypothetical protein
MREGPARAFIRRDAGGFLLDDPFVALLDQTSFVDLKEGLGKLGLIIRCDARFDRVKAGRNLENLRRNLIDTTYDHRRAAIEESEVV